MTLKLSKNDFEKPVEHSIPLSKLELLFGVIFMSFVYFLTFKGHAWQFYSAAIIFFVFSIKHLKDKNYFIFSLFILITLSALIFYIQRSLKPASLLINVSGSYHVFFIITDDDREYLSNRQQCAIESAAKLNPHAQITVYSRKARLNGNINSSDLDLLDIYRNIREETLDLEEIFNATALHSWYTKKEWVASPHKFSHISDAARLALLWKHGGLYVDLDTITLKNLEPLTTFSSVGYIFEDHFETVNNAIMSFEKHHPLLESIMSSFGEVYRPQEWITAGPDLIRKQMHSYCKSDDIFASQLIDKTTFETLVAEQKPLSEPKWKSFQYSNNQSSSNKCDVLIYPSAFYYPFNYMSELGLLFGRDSKPFISKLKDTFLVHYFNQMSSKLKVKLGDNSLFEYLTQNNCPTVYSRVKKQKGFL